MSLLAAERSPLLGATRNISVAGSRRRSCGNRFANLFKKETEPSWLESIRFLFSTSWVNSLLVFIPLSFISHHARWDAAIRFTFSFLALIPLAALLGTATEQLSLEVGQTLSGLLNASFGNAVEIIVAVAALMRGELRIVQTSLLGSILSNLLSVLGCAFFAGGLKYKETSFDAQISSSLMTLTCITLVIPAAYHATQSDTTEGDNFKFLFNHAPGGVTSFEYTPDEGLLWISRGTAILLLIVYVLYLVFQLKTHTHLYNKFHQSRDDDPEMSSIAAGITLLVVTVLTGFCADYLVESITKTVEKYNISERFIGIILIPIVGNAAEYVTSMWMATKNKMELAIGICVGSAIQIASLVIPLLVIIGWIADRHFTLFFEDFETIVLFVSVLLVNFLIQSGKSNYLQGIILIVLYLVIAITFWVS